MHRHRYRALWRAAVLLIALSTSAAALDAAQVLHGHVPAAAKAGSALGRVPAASVLQLSVGLPLRNRDALTNLLQRLYDPASPDFRHFLSVEQFTEQFGPSAAEYEAVTSFLQKRGLAVTGTHPNRLIVDVSGSVGDIESAFHVRMNRHRHPHENREFYAPDSEPSLDLEAPVQDIAGLDNFTLPRPANLVRQPAPLPSEPRPMAGSGPNGAYMGLDFRAAYAPNVTLNGSGQYVGLLQFDGYYSSDIAAYVSRVPGMTNVALTNILLNGFSGSPGSNNVEVALDIEMAISMAPGLSAVLVYEGSGSGNTILNRMATDNLAKQLSASWSFSGNGTTTAIFQQFAAQGQSYFNASGDDGAYSGTVPQPTDNPYITSVGGTTLSTRGPAQGWLSETTWRWSSSSGSSGGVSPTFPIPSWQEGVDMSLNQGSTTGRNIPDVAMVADNVFAIVDNGTQSYVGGTSVAAPLWAAYLALANQQAAILGQPSVGFINPLIYPLGQGTAYASAFHDIKTGNNTSVSSPNAFYAVAGYDLCTGWGTPSGKGLINGLVPPPNYPVLAATGLNLVTETCMPTNGAADPGEVVVMNFSLQNYGSVSTTNLIATLLNTNGIIPAGGPQSFGVLPQGTVVSRQFTFIPQGDCGGTVNPVLQLQDGSTDLGLVSFSLVLGAPKNALAQNFDSVATPALPSGWTSAVLNSASNWVTTTASRDTTPNSAFSPDTTTPGSSDLLSPVVAIQTASAQLVFRHSYNLEADPSNSTNAYDGAVLDMKIGSGGFRDILLQGGSFVNGAYTRTITPLDNPLKNRQCWAGSSAGFITTTVNLPASVAGQTVQFKWRLGMNTGNLYTGTGWYVDTVAVKDGLACCTPETNADLSITQSVYPDPGVIGQSLAFTHTVRSLGPGPATNVTLTNTLPSNSTFVWASNGYTNLSGVVVWNLGLMPLGRTTNLTLLVTPTDGTAVTNVALVSTSAFDPVPDNNTSMTIVQLAGLPEIVAQPIDQVAAMGGEVTFLVDVTGTGLTYQWFFEGQPLAGQTDAVLVLTNVQPAQSGPYSVVISNGAGSTNSTAAVLKVLVPPLVALSGVNISSTNVSVSLSSVAGLNYILEYKDAITDTTWLPVGEAVAGTGGDIFLQDTNSPPPPTRFYRVNCGP